MLEYSFTHWVTFLTAAALLAATPGPDIAFMLGQTLKGGRKGGVAAMLGIWSGAFGHVIMAVLGLSAIIATSALAFSIVKWAGAVYLIWLGIAAFMAAKQPLSEAAIAEESGFASVYVQGMLVALLNPKVALFFLLFLPQFVVDGAGPVWAQLMLHGTLVIVVAAVIEPPLVLSFSRITRNLSKNGGFRKWMDRVLGGVFIGLGVRLALSEKTL